MEFLKYFLILFINSLFINISNCGNILVLFPTSSKSHSILGVALAKGLAKKGHNVTFVSQFPQDNKFTEYHDVGLTDTKDYLKNQIDKSGGIFKVTGDTGATMAFQVFRISYELTKEILEDKAMVQIMNSNEKYDAIILGTFLNDALLGLGNHFKAPVIIFSTGGPSFFTNSYIGNPSPYSYVPEAILTFSDHMTFYERLINSVLQFSLKMFMHWFHYPAQEEILHKYFPDAPGIHEVAKNIALILANSHSSLGYPQPLVPNFIEVGGLQVPKPNPLPKDLQEFIDDAKDGVIYFSLGTNVRSKDMPIEMKNSLVAAFAKLKQKVLWKWDDPSIPGLSKNVRLGKWYPQGDILAHPNVKLFITHGGLLSTTETVMRGVPCIGIPVFADQFKNMEKSEKDGYAIKIDHKNITESTMTWAINEMINNPKYTENVKRRSALFNDAIVPPLDKAVYWVEYVIRHKGAPHLRSAGADIPLYQYLLLDIISFILFILFLIFTISYLVIKTIIKFVKTKFFHKKDKKD